GRENDGTGVYYYGARYYHPQLQRFISEDPIGFLGGGPNLSAYVANAPTNYRDPSGLELVGVSAGFSGFFGYSVPNGSGPSVNVGTAGTASVLYGLNVSGLEVIGQGYAIGKGFASFDSNTPSAQ